jgi:hypothetical protein
LNPEPGGDIKIPPLLFWAIMLQKHIDFYGHVNTLPQQGDS